MNAYNRDRVAAAKYLGVSLSFLDHACAARGIAFVKLGRRSLFAEADLDRYIESRRVEPATQGKVKGRHA